MPNPTINDIQAVDPVLTNTLIAYRQNDARFVSGKVFKSVPVDLRSGTYYILTQKYWFLDEMARRAPGGKFARGDYGVETATFEADLWGLEHPVPIENENNNQVPMSLLTIGSEWLAVQSIIRRERKFAETFMASGVWSNEDNNSATDWDDFANGDPLLNVKTGKRTISQSTGMTPNTMLVGEIVDDALTLHPDILDRIKYTVQATGQAVDAALAAIFKLERYIVAEAIYNTANEAQTASYSPIIDDDALLLYVAPGQADMFTVTAGKTFGWRGGGGEGEVVRYWDQSVKSWIIQNSEAWEMKVIAAGLGYLWLDIV